MSARRHVCYFSMTCRHCQAFLGELTKTPYAREFQLVCVDPSPSRPPLPSWLRMVPSLEIVGESEPRTGAAAVNNWLFERRQRDATPATGGAGIRTSAGEKTLEERSIPLTMPVYSPELTRAEPSSAGCGAPPPTAAGGEPSAWHGNEMGAAKMSDNYSFLTDAFTLEKGGSMSRIVRNFEQLTTAAAAAAAATPAPRTKKEDALSRDFEAFSRSRDADIPGPTKRI